MDEREGAPAPRPAWTPPPKPGVIRRLAGPAIAGAVIGALFRLWAAALYRPAGSYAVMPGSALVVFGGVLLLGIASLVAFILVARPSSQRTGFALLVAEGASVLAWLVVGLVAGPVA